MLLSQHCLRDFTPLQLFYQFSKTAVQELPSLESQLHRRVRESFPLRIHSAHSYVCYEPSLLWTVIMMFLTTIALKMGIMSYLSTLNMKQTIMKMEYFWGLERWTSGKNFLGVINKTVSIQQWSYILFSLSFPNFTNNPNAS